MTRFPLLMSLLASAALLAGCGGGGGSSGTPVATVTSVSAATPAYRQSVIFTVNGANLDTGISLSSAACASPTLLTTAPNASTATTAYFRCTVTAVGVQQASVVRNSDNSAIGTTAYTVPEPQVTLNVSNGAGVAGNLVFTLKPTQTPITVDNFLAYVNAGFYDGTIFHRNAPNFVLQAGGYASPVAASGTPPTHKATNAPIALEVGKGLSNVRLSVAMARTTAPNSATSEFFINVVDNVALDTAGGGYAVFGNVTAGADVVTAMANAPCSAYPALLPAGDCLPVPNIVIVTARQTR